jgi:hypothetical protein
MSVLPKLNMTELKGKTARQLREERTSYEVTADGAMVGILIIPQNDYVLAQSEVQANMSNVTAGTENGPRHTGEEPCQPA